MYIHADVYLINTFLRQFDELYVHKSVLVRTTS